MSITAQDRQEVRQTHNFRCGYCGVSESDIGGQLEIDHYRPTTKGGRDNLDNLVYACVHCNRFKGNYWPDGDDPQSFYLLHPGEDELSQHVQITVSGRIEGLTPRGWFHLHRLRPNRPQLVVWRQNRQRFVELSEALKQSEAKTSQLRHRIRQLEQEALRLRQQIARLSGSDE